jgi:DNA-binding MarR family transcriptional regulator|tara:strand:- start:358 stop:615 length:258 start_codon:yes stop_codon:yes gene_type:complete
MVQETSFDAFESIQDTLGKRQARVYGILKEQGECSNMDISIKLSMPINQITPRTNELVKMGLVKNSGKKKDSITNRLVMIWDINH